MRAMLNEGDVPKHQQEGVHMKSDRITTLGRVSRETKGPVTQAIVADSGAVIIGVCVFDAVAVNAYDKGTKSCASVGGTFIPKAF